MNDDDDQIETPSTLSEIVGDFTLPAFVERNLCKAFGLLSSSVISAITGTINRREAEKWSDTMARIKISETVATQIIENLDVPPGYPKAAANSFAARIVRGQANIDTIVRRAAEHISSTPTESDAKECGEISDDFLEHFENEARKQNTDSMRDLFARILAGEIQRPGSYSIRLIRILSEITPQIARTFQCLCSICIAIPMKDDVRAATLGVEGNALYGYGLGYGQLLELQEYGLIVFGFSPRMSYEESVDYLKRPHDVTPIQYQDQYWRLVPENVDKNHPLMIAGVPLTKIGRELFTVVDQKENPNYTKALHEYFQTMKMTMQKL